MSLLHIDFRDKTIERVPKISINKKDKYQIVISFDMLPKHCGECPLYQWNETYDEDAFFGDGYSNSCPFGCTVWESLIKRPADCPIKEA